MTSPESLFAQPVRSTANWPDRSDAAETLCIVASIANLRGIDRAWGSQPALAVRHVVLERARELCRSVPGIAVLSGDLILFVFDLPLSGLPSATPDSAQVGVLLDRMLCDLADQPIDIAGDAVFVALSVSVVEQMESAFDIADIAAASAATGADQPGQEEQRWRARFFADMKAAEHLFSANDRDRLVFDAQAVRNLHHAEAVRYYEVLPFMTWQGASRPVAEMVMPLDRLGLIRRLDRWSVETAICALQSNPGVSLGCNVTSQSASLDAWWTLVIAMLSEQRAVAKRLVIELSEVAPTIDLARVGAFVHEFRALGCQVALDNVGGGGSSIAALASLGVDIVKIDAGRLHEARARGRANDFLRDLVTLARGTGADVVITGVEDEADVDVAARAGATHIQGPYVLGEVPADLNINSPN